MLVRSRNAPVITWSHTILTSKFMLNSNNEFKFFIPQHGLWFLSYGRHYSWCRICDWSCHLLTTVGIHAQCVSVKLIRLGLHYNYHHVIHSFHSRVGGVQNSDIHFGRLCISIATILGGYWAMSRGIYDDINTTNMFIATRNYGFTWLYIPWTFTAVTNKQKQTPWPESASELYRPRDHRLSAKLMPTFEDRGVLCSQRGGFPMAVISVF
jgi:hypothetical protein